MEADDLKELRGENLTAVVNSKGINPSNIKHLDKGAIREIADKLQSSYQGTGTVSLSIYLELLQCLDRCVSTCQLAMITWFIYTCSYSISSKILKLIWLALVQ